MQIVSAEDNLHGMSNHVEIICLKFMSKPVFREKCKKTKQKKTSKCCLLKILYSVLRLKTFT